MYQNSRCHYYEVISYARNITPKHLPCHGEKKQHVSLNIANCPSRALFCSEGAECMLHLANPLLPWLSGFAALWHARQTLL